MARLAVRVTPIVKSDYFLITMGCGGWDLPPPKKTEETLHYQLTITALQTFIPISMFDKWAKGTSLVTSSHSRMAKLHMSADRRLISSGFFCRAKYHKEQQQKQTLKYARYFRRKPFYSISSEDLDKTLQVCSLKTLVQNLKFYNKVVHLPVNTFN